MPQRARSLFHNHPLKKETQNVEIKKSQSEWIKSARLQRCMHMRNWKNISCSLPREWIVDWCIVYLCKNTIIRRANTPQDRFVGHDNDSLLNTGDSNRSIIKTYHLHIGNIMMNFLCECGRTLFFSLCSSNWVRVRKEEAVKLCPVFCTEQQRRQGKKTKNRNWPLSQLLHFGCITETFFPVWWTFISNIWTTCTLGAAG